MRFIDYIVNKEDQFLGTNEEKEQHHSFYQKENLIGTGLLVGGILVYTPLVIPGVIIAADIALRLRRNAYQEKPTSGLVGLMREYLSKE